MRRVVIVGYGMAGARLAEEIRAREPEGARVAVTVLGAEAHPAYNRVLLSHVMAGALSPQELLLHGPEWAERNHVDLRRGARVARIDRPGRRVLLSDGGAVPYDRLVLATGAQAWLPPVEGLITDDDSLADGVAVLRTLDDCDRILAALRPGTRVAVLGGGLLGLETAGGLARRGHPTTVVHPGTRLMDRQLDAAGARVLRRVLGALGVDVLLHHAASRFVPGDGLKLDDGTHVPADLVVVCAGVRADTALAAAAGIGVGRGVLVDDELRTSDPLVHAIGDCAQHPGAPAGLVQPAWDQAKVVADLLTDSRSDARYQGTRVATSLKVRDVDLLAVGDTHAEPDDTGAEVLRLEDPARGRYAKLVLREGRVAGAIMIGFPAAGATISYLHDKGTPAPADRLALLLGRAAPDAAHQGELPEETVICRCNSVTKGALVAAWRAGAHTSTALAERTKATTGCGTCRDSVCALVRTLSPTGGTS